MKWTKYQSKRAYRHKRPAPADSLPNCSRCQKQPADYNMRLCMDCWSIAATFWHWNGYEMNYHKIIRRH